jgi:hypothetical protein
MHAGLTNWKPPPPPSLPDSHVAIMFFLSTMDLLVQGVRTLWGSFEIKNTRLISSMLTQLVGGKLAGLGASTSNAASAAATPSSVPPSSASVLQDHFSGYASEFAPPWQMGATSAGLTASEAGILARYELAADTLADLPMAFLRFHGATDVDRVLDALDYAAYAQDVDHVVLDNLQFMMSQAAAVSGSGGSSRWGSADSKFELQDRAIDRFRAFATVSLYDDTN